jgi:hypothetical protein
MEQLNISIITDKTKANFFYDDDYQEVKSLDAELKTIDCRNNGHCRWLCGT